MAFPTSIGSFAKEVPEEVPEENEKTAEVKS